MWEIAVRHHWFVSVCLREKSLFIHLFSYLNVTASLQEPFVKDMSFLYALLMPLLQTLQVATKHYQSINHTINMFTLEKPRAI